VNLKSSIKRLLPPELFEYARRSENWLRRSWLGHQNPVVLEDDFGVRFLLYPPDKNPIRWQLHAGTNREEFKEIEKRLKRCDVVFDAGANIGLVSAFASLLVGEKGVVHAFEPHPTTVLELKKTLALSECQNVVVNPVALSSSVGMADFYYVPNHKLNSLGPIADKTYGENEVMKVPTTTIDAYCVEHNVSHIDFLKIDVEGFEQSVLEGARNMLAKKAIKCIQFEMHHEDSGLVAYLEAYGYKLEPHASGFNWYATV
jgi:FkbM family methyltransferase